MAIASITHDTGIASITQDTGIASITHDTEWLQVTFTDGETGKFYVEWLRDNVPSGRHQDRGQRTFDINSLPQQSLSEVTHTDDQVTITFDFERCSHVFTASWLHSHRNPSTLRTNPTPVLWNAEGQNELCFADYSTLKSSRRDLHSWLRHIRDYGYGLLENVPTKPGTVLEVVEMFGYVRDTNYGKLFEVRAEPNPSNLAFTKLGIGMHTDNPYRDPVPGLQLLHCLVNESDGGDTQLVDGFAVAEEIRQKYPEAFWLLSTQPVRFRYLDERSADLEATSPLIETNSHGEVIALRYNSRSAQAFTFPSEVMADYYAAYRLLGELLHKPEARIEFRLTPGQLMIFDNQRVLHGRSSYEEGSRHLQGCYADKDSLRSFIRVLEEDK